MSSARAIDIGRECVFCTAHRRHAEEKRSSMLVEAAIFAANTKPKTSTAKGGTTR